MIIPAFVIGLIASVVTEFLKLIPWLSATDDRKRLSSFGLAFLLSILYIVSEEPDVSTAFAIFVTAAASSFVVYKTIILPAEALAISIFGLAKRILRRETKISSV